ncbi:MAG: TIGR00282 family metallophosphoesterase [Rhodospirillales bacterium]|nr:TIGR00282 family metallophosphoesterase [Rhodospirillales bacterium]
MRIIYFGDIVGKAGRTVVLKELPRLRRELGADFVIVNGENAAHGFGITRKICQSLLTGGADVVVTGNHVWDQRETADFIDDEPRLLRPVNFPPHTPGNGFGVFDLADGRKILVAQTQGRLFMNPLDDPFRCIDLVVHNHPLGKDVNAAFVDIHAEATSEKMGMGHFLDGRVSAVVGSHTHIPTADAQILPGGTAYLTDIGMCGDYNSVIGMKKDTALARLTRVTPADRLEPATGEATLCAALLETDDDTGLAKTFEPIRVGGRLRPVFPNAASFAANPTE